jgi:hypothetical protein
MRQVSGMQREILLKKMLKDPLHSPLACNFNPLLLWCSATQCYAVRRL